MTAIVPDPGITSRRGCRHGYEIDPSARAWSGGLCDEGRRGWLQDLSANDAGRAAFRDGEWNHYRIECDGPSIRAWVNGIPTADWIDPLDVEGFVALQVHSGRDTDVLWRDLRIEDRGTRAWLPFPDSKATRIESPEGITVLVGPEMIDGAVRRRVRGCGVIVGARESQACFASPMRRALAPGLELLEHGYRVHVDELPPAAGETWETAHDVVIRTWGTRITVHVDGRCAIDVRDAAHSGGIATIVLEPEAQPGDVERAEYLGPPVR
jgi:hypothetical protein